MSDALAPRKTHWNFSLWQKELVATLSVVLLIRQHCSVTTAEAASRGLVKDRRQHEQIRISSLRNVEMSPTAKPGHACQGAEISWCHS